MSRSVNFSVNGAPTNINSIKIDGAASGGIIDSTFTYIPALDAIQEVNVVIGLDERTFRLGMRFSW